MYPNAMSCMCMYGPSWGRIYGGEHGQWMGHVAFDAIKIHTILTCMSMTHSLDNCCNEHVHVELDVCGDGPDPLCRDVVQRTHLGDNEGKTLGAVFVRLYLT